MYAANHRINNQASSREVYRDKHDYSEECKLILGTILNNFFRMVQHV